MPVIVEEDYTNEWLRHEVKSDSDKQALQALITACPASNIAAHTVGKLRGKEAIGNSPEDINKVVYPELDNAQGSLFWQN